jgi:hypothetical protein
VVHGATVTDLDRLAPRYDLTIIAAGKGELVAMFDRDPSRSPYARRSARSPWPTCTAWPRGPSTRTPARCAFR